MSHRHRSVYKVFVVIVAAAALVIAGTVVPEVDARAGARGARGGRGGGHAGPSASGFSRSGGFSGGTRAGAVHTGFGRGFRGGSGHRFQGGGSWRSGGHSFRRHHSGFNRFHRRSSVFVNFGGFIYPHSYYPAYPYYPQYPYYDPSYAAYPMQYGYGGYGVTVQDPYAYPIAAYPETSRNDVIVYTAPPEQTPPQVPQPAPSAPSVSSSSLPLEDGSLHFKVTPPEARIFLDGIYLGKAKELEKVSEITARAGRRLLEIRVGAERTFEQVMVFPGKVTPVRLELAPPLRGSDGPKPETGRLHVQAIPSGAAIYIDGVLSTTTDQVEPVPVNVSSGDHHIKVVMPGFKQYVTTINVPDGGEAVLAVQLARE